MSNPIRPLVETEILTEFGAVQDDPEFRNETSMARDVTYVPGISDQRRARDIALGEVVKGKRAMKDVPTLTHNTRLVRRVKYSGAQDTTRGIEVASEGYKFVTKDDLGKPWLTAMPPGGSVLPDGTVVINDCALMVTDAKNAAKRSAIKQARTTEQHQMRPEESLSDAAKKQGTSASFERTTVTTQL